MTCRNKMRRETLNEFIQFKKLRRHNFKFDYLVSKYIDYRKSMTKKKDQTSNSLNESRILINKLFKMYHDLNSHLNIHDDFHDKHTKNNHNNHNTTDINNNNNKNNNSMIDSSNIRLYLLQKQNFISYPRKELFDDSSEV